jgi:hypothetical protein
VLRDSKILTNGGPFYDRLEAALCEYLDVEHMVVVQTELRGERPNRWLGICYASNTLFQISGAVLPVIRSLERSNWRL